MATIDIGRIKIVWRGVYDPLKIYQKDDAVYYNGSAFIALDVNQNVLPTAGGFFWDLMVQGFEPGTQILIVENIAALRSAGVGFTVEGGVAYVKGYYQSNDNGGGYFQWSNSSAAADDNGYVIAPSSGTGRWLRHFENNTANVKMWGAYGDGSSDDTTSIQSAVSAALTLGLDSLYFTPGNYIVSNTITTTADLAIHGTPSADRVTITQSNVGADTFHVNPTTDPYSHFILADVALYTQSTTNVGVVINPGTVKCALKGITVNGGGCGVKIIDSGNSFYSIEGSTFIDNFSQSILLTPNSNAIPTRPSSLVIRDLFATLDQSFTSAVLTNQGTIANINISQFNIDGDFVNGVVQASVPASVSTVIPGQIKIENGVYTGSSTAPFITVSSTNPGGVILSTVIEVNNVLLQGVNYTIQDSIAGYNMPAPASVKSQQVSFVYNPANKQVGARRTGISTIQFTPSQTGWYTIFTGSSALNCNLTIGSTNEATNFDAFFNVLSAKGLIKVNRFDPDASPFVTRARTLAKNGNAYVDIEVTTSGYPLNITHYIDERNTVPSSGLCVPTLQSTLDETVSGYVGYEEVAFANGLVLSTSGKSSDAHVKLGTNHIFFDDNNDLRLYNEGVELLFIGGGGTGAKARAYIENGQPARVHLINRGTGYTSAPTVVAAVRNGNGTDATFTATLSGSVIGGVTASGGNFYGQSPVGNEAYSVKIVTDPPNVRALYQGTPIHVARRFSYDLIYLNFTAGSPIVTTNAPIHTASYGVNLFTYLFPGDIIRAPNGSFYEVQQIVDWQTAVLTSNYPSTQSNAQCLKVGWELLPAIPGYKYRITAVHIMAVETPNWQHGGAAGGFNLIVRSKYTYQNIAYYPALYMDDAGGDDYQNVSFMQNYMNATPVRPWDNTPPFGIATNGYGIGSYLPDSCGVEFGFFKDDGVTRQPPTAGSVTCIEVQGMKYLNGSKY